MVLAHYQDSAGSSSGLTISDRPGHSLLDALRQLGLQPGASREQLAAAVQALPENERGAKVRELFGTSRAFFGTTPTGEARMELRDGRGRVRIVIETPKQGEPSIRILDEHGGIAFRFPR